MYRRELIALFGGSLVALSGCGSDGEGIAQGVDVSFEAVQPKIVELRTDSLTLSAGDFQYLYVQVETDPDASPRPESFRFRFDGDEYNPLDRHDVYRNRIESPYSQSSGEGWLLFELPPEGNADDARLVLGQSEWAPSASIRELLATPPASLTVKPSFPETVSLYETPEISITVTNNDDRPGWFVAGLDRSGPSVARTPVARISESVPAAETVELTIPDERRMESASRDERGDGEPDFRYYLVWISDAAEGAVRMVD